MMKKEKIFWGIFFILAGIFLIVSRLGYLGEVRVFSFVLTVFLIASIIMSLRHLNFVGILFPIAFICIIYDDVLGIEQLTPWPVLGAALFGSIGLSMIFHSNHQYNHHRRFFCSNVNDEEHFDEVIDQEDGNSFKCETTFGSSIKYVNSDDFTQGRIRCSFGAMKVYFDNAVIQSGNAVINLDVSFAGVELFIPKEWKVIDKVDTSFGAIEEKNRNISTGIPCVTLVGSVKFAGVTIIYV
jgi:predicted membrane protein